MGTLLTTVFCDEEDAGVSGNCKKHDLHHASAVPSCFRFAMSGEEHGKQPQYYICLPINNASSVQNVYN
jgi:hypothetical protein